MRLDTVVDERTLRELYLTGFEIAVTESAPWTVMSAYNLVNGEHAGESRRLLTDILRTEWGFGGLVVSDWFATSDRPAGVHAGLDLEMPGSAGAWDARVEAALDSGTLAEADLDLACTRVVELAQRVAAEKSAREGSPPVDHAAHHALARRAAAAADRAAHQRRCASAAASRPDRAGRSLRREPAVPGRRQLHGHADPPGHRARGDARTTR